MKFSKLKQSFYPDDLIADYAAAGTLPDDLIDMSDADHAALFAPNKIIDWSGAAPVAADTPAIDPKIDIQAQIDAIERETMTNRGARELHIGIMRREGQAMGLADDPAIAAKVPYFAKLIAIDAQVRALRAQL